MVASGWRKCGSVAVTNQQWRKHQAWRNQQQHQKRRRETMKTSLASARAHVSDGSAANSSYSALALCRQAAINKNDWQHIEAKKRNRARAVTALSRGEIIISMTWRVAKGVSASAAAASISVISSSIVSRKQSAAA